MLPVSVDIPTSDSLLPSAQPEQQFPGAFPAVQVFDAKCQCFLPIKFRCQVNRVSGVTMVATCANVLRPSFFALQPTDGADYR